MEKKYGIRLLVVASIIALVSIINSVQRDSEVNDDMYSAFTEDIVNVDENNKNSISIVNDSQTEINEGLPLIEGTEYEFLSGKMAVVMSEDEYDVFTEDTPFDSPALAHQKLEKDRVDLYVVLSGYSLIAVPVGDSLADSQFEIKVNIKEPKYDAISNLKDLDQDVKDECALALVSSFSADTNTYTWCETPYVDWIVFECDMQISKELRYATIIDGRMIYIIAGKPDTYPSNAESAEVERIVRNIKWDI